jgi:hypothetical protein
MTATVLRNINVDVSRQTRKNSSWKCLQSLLLSCSWYLFFNCTWSLPFSLHMLTSILQLHAILSCNVHKFYFLCLCSFWTLAKSPLCHLDWFTCMGLLFLLSVSLAYQGGPMLRIVLAYTYHSRDHLRAVVQNATTRKWTPVTIRSGRHVNAWPCSPINLHNHNR